MASLPASAAEPERTTTTTSAPMQADAEGRRDPANEGGAADVITTEDVTPTEAPHEEDPEGQGWGLRVDGTYDALAVRVESTARWVDGFFGTERAEVEANFSYLRLTPSIGWDTDEGTSGNIRARGKLDLPNSKQKLSLILAGEGDQNALQISNADEQDLLLDDRSGEDGSIGLQFLAQENRKYHTSFNATLTSGGQPRLSMRVRRTFEPSDELYGFVSARPYWHSEDGFGVRFNTQGNRALGERTLLRLTASAETYEDREDWEWDSGAALFHRLESRAVVALSFQVNGISSPSWKAETYTLGPLYRQSFYRPWMFWSLQPFVRWNTPEALNSSRDHGVVLELDMFIGEQRRTRKANDGV
jgi:hypothetical protein